MNCRSCLLVLIELVFISALCLVSWQRIPTKFARKYGSDLSDSIRLKVPSGFIWEVKLRRKDKDILMQDGWAEFMEHYRISHGSFVVFKYEGGSQFRVVIFDLTACEIEYPIEPVVCTERDVLADQPLFVPEREKTRDKEAPNILWNDDEDDVRLLGNHKMRKCVQCPRSTVAKIVSGLRAANYLSEMGVHAMVEELDGARTRETFDRHARAGEMRTSYIKILERSTALSRVSSFRRDRPSFVVLPSFFDSEYYLYVPEKFIMTRAPGIGDCLDVKVYIPGLRMWTVGFHVGKGWQQFMVDNNLKVGDVCLFELTERSVLTYRAFIFRDGGVSQLKTMPMKKRPKTMESVYQEYLSRLDDVYISEVNDQVSGINPSFHVVFKRKVENTLAVPWNFASIHLQQLLLEPASHVTLKAGGKSWPVTLLSAGNCSDSCLLSRGWLRFAKDNSLQWRDICLFELIDKTDMVFEVSILKSVAP